MGKKITLACSICHNRNYSTEKNTKRSERIEIKKFCKNCKQHTIHRETK